MYDLTSPQKNIFMVQQYQSNAATNNISGLFKISDNFNTDICNKVVKIFIDKNYSLSLQLQLQENGIIKQFFKKEYNIKEFDFSYLESKVINGKLNDLASKEMNILNNSLAEFNIINFGNNKGAIMCKFHHMIADAWTFSLTLEQLSSIYDAYVKGKENELNLTEKKPSYLDFINSEKEFLKSEKYIKSKFFWESYLKNIHNQESLSNKVIKPKSEAKRYSVKLDRELTENINNYVKNNKIAITSVFLGAVSTYVYRIKNDNDIILGIPILNRSNFKEKQTTGMYISSAAVRVKIKGKITFIELLKNISKDLMSVFRHRKYPLSETISYVHKNEGIKDKLFNILISYQNSRANIVDKTKYSSEWIFSKAIQHELEIHVMDMDNDGILTINYDYLIDLFDDIDIEYLHRRIINIIKEALNKKDINLEDISLVDEQEIKIINSINDTKLKYINENNIIDLFYKIADRKKNDIALVCNNEQLTFQQLNFLSDTIAFRLMVEYNVKKNDTIAVMMKRSINLAATLIAIVKCGCAYVPIDTTYPKERKDYVVENSNSKLVIIDEFNDESKYVNIKELIKPVNISKINSFIKASVSIDLNDNIYTIYTSGTTSNPKGVQISHKNLKNFLGGINKEIKLNSEDTVVSITTISFDIFGLEFWLSILLGIKLVIANEQEQIDGNLLNKLCSSNKVNTIQTTPSKLKLLMQNSSNLNYIINMKNVLLGGENLTKDIVNNVKEITKANIFNVYGPTETTIWSTTSNITNKNYITVGKPISNTLVKIVDNKNRIMPLNTSGQLLIGGDSVSKGYLNNKQLTNDKFKYNEEYQTYIYQTGDLAKIDYNLEIIIEGRQDFQVKLHGQRIELEEIEEKIKECDGNINNVIVMVKNDKLICYYTLLNKKIKTDLSRLSKCLLDKLPLYMVPNKYIYLDNMIYTPNGKIDRKSLIKLDIDINESDKQVEIIMPLTNIEKTIFEVWKSIFKDKEFGIMHNFFDLNGDSLDAINTRVKLLSNNINVEYDALFRYPTIKLLADYVENKIKKEQYKVNNFNKDYTEILEKNKNNNILNKDLEIKGILLTGATGFLGSHILSEYIKNETGKIYCIIREKKELDSKTRLINTLHYYFGNEYDELIDKRIFVVNGDITKKENLGMNATDYQEIISKIEYVINSAACVKHYGDEVLFKKINVNAVKNISNFCIENNKKLIHISTLSVSGNAFEAANLLENKNEKETMFDETSFYQGQSLNNLYIYTKFLAEEVILDNIKNNNLKANIIRFGNLTGRFDDLKFQENVSDNAFANRVKSILTIGKIPKNIESLYLEFTPIDFSGLFVIKIMQYFNMQNTIFHAFNHNHITISNLINAVNELGMNLEIIEDSEFSNIVKELINKNDVLKLKGIVNDLDDNNDLAYTSNIKITSDITVNYLKKIGFKWPYINENYVKKYLNYLKNIGFLNI